MEIRDYITLFMSAIGCLTGLVSLIITLTKYKYEKPRAQIIDVDFERHIELNEFDNSRNLHNAEFNVFILAKISNSSLFYPLKLDYAEVEYRERQLYRTKNGTNWREKVLLDETIEKGENCKFKFYFRGTIVPYDKDSKNFEVEIPQNMMLSRIRFHYSGKNTKWFILGELFIEKYIIPLNSIKESYTDREKQSYLIGLPRSIKHPKIHIITNKFEQNIKHYLKKINCTLSKRQGK